MASVECEGGTGEDSASRVVFATRAHGNVAELGADTFCDKRNLVDRGLSKVLWIGEQWRVADQMAVPHGRRTDEFDSAFVGWASGKRWLRWVHSVFRPHWVFDRLEFAKC